MKKLPALLLLLLLVQTALAQRPRSVLKVRLSDGSPLAISIDDRQYNKQGRSLTIGDLPAGKHYIKIYRYIAYRDEQGGRAKPLYSATLKMPKNSVVTLTYDVDMRSVRLHTEYTDGSVAPEETTGGSDDDFNDKSYQEPKHTDDVYATGSLSQKNIDNLKVKVDDRLTDTDKQKLMQVGLENKTYSTEQVRSMLPWLSFESSRLDFAKWAYKNVTDQQNYSTLANEFTNKSSKDELNGFIKK